ncbi:MAG: carbon-nitrogen hydrolase family protein [Spirochaetales bacterium]|nr:carbon-nitrogen hydrolase family protein [Spirochaetales bacterium]
MPRITTFKIAAVQSEPIYFNREASTTKACELINDAAETGAVLAAFGESWLPGYPFFVWGDLSSTIPAHYLSNAVEIPGPTTDLLCDAARGAGIDVVIGVAERDTATRGTVYCTLLFIGREGTILGRHRKLKPTYRERVIWGEGDGAGLAVYERPYGRISGLNCWEHNMVLPGYTLIAQGAQIHIAAWPGQEEYRSRHLILSRAFASQAAAYVIDVGALLTYENLSKEYRDFVDAVPARYRTTIADYPGESCIIDPRGNVIAGPVHGERILVAECSQDAIRSAKTICDVAGHYARPDVFQLTVRADSRKNAVELADTDSRDEAEE